MWVEEAALRFWLAELWLGDQIGILFLKAWGMKAWWSHFTHLFCLPCWHSLLGRSFWITWSIQNLLPIYTNPFGSKLKTPQKSQKTVLPKLCSSEWSSCPDTAVLLTGVFLKAEQGLLLLPKISLEYFTELSVLNQSNCSSDVISEDAKAGKAGEESWDLWLSGLPGGLSHTCCWE